MTHAYPLGQPVNRQSAPERVPVPGRPNWYSNGRGGEPFYVEPVKPAQPAGFHPRVTSDAVHHITEAMHRIAQST